MLDSPVNRVRETGEHRRTSARIDHREMDRPARRSSRRSVPSWKRPQPWWTSGRGGLACTWSTVSGQYPSTTRISRTATASPPRAVTNTESTQEEEPLQNPNHHATQPVEVMTTQLYPELSTIPIFALLVARSQERSRDRRLIIWCLSRLPSLWIEMTTKYEQAMATDTPSRLPNTYRSYK